MNSSDRAARAADLLFAEIDGEAVALNAQKGVCYGLNAVGLRVLELMETPASLAEICARLTDEYDVDPATCTTQVGELLSDLEREGLVVIERSPQTS
jgi:PqqD family protein of HPr-rel-A system